MLTLRRHLLARYGHDLYSLNSVGQDLWWPLLTLKIERSTRSGVFRENSASKKFSAFMGPEVLLPCSEDHGTGPYSNPE
jgi:hypothetical protein